MQIDDSFTVKKTFTPSRNLSTKMSLKNQIYFRRKPVLFAKVLTLSATKGKKAKIDNKKEFKDKESKKNLTRNNLNIKIKVLHQLQQLENDMKVVKAQIENDTKTIEDLQNQLRQKEKQRANLKRIIEKNTHSSNAINEKPTLKMLSKNLDNDRPTTDKNEDFKFNFEENQKEQKQKHIQANGSDLHKFKYRRHSNVTKRDHLKNTSKNIITNKIERNDLNEDFYLDEIKKNENTQSSTSKSKSVVTYITIYKNISNEENFEDLTVTTPSMFDLHEDFETFERFDGEFDWEKFVTSEIYIQMLKNSTAEPAEFRRILNNEKSGVVTTSTTDTDLYEAVTSLADKFWDDYYLEPPVTDHPPFVSNKSNNSTARFVPRPSRHNDFEETVKITLPEIKNFFKRNPVRKHYLNNARRNLGTLYPTIDGRKNMPTLPTTIRTTVDQILYDSIIRDIDKATEI